MGDPTKLYTITCNKIHFPKQHVFEERRGWQIHLFVYPFRQKKNILLKRRKELGKQADAKGQIPHRVRVSLPCEQGYRPPMEHPFSARTLPYLLGYRGFLAGRRHLCISVLPYGSLQKGKDWGKPLVPCNRCSVPGGSSQQKHSEEAVRQHLGESICIVNWEGDWGTDKLFVFLGGLGLTARLDCLGCVYLSFPKQVIGYYTGIVA